MKLSLAFRPGRKMTLEEIEREAAAEIQQRVNAGKPPADEWAGLGERREQLDVDVSGFGKWGEPGPLASEPMAGGPVTRDEPATTTVPDEPAQPATVDTGPAGEAAASPLAMPPTASAPVRRPSTARTAPARKPVARKPTPARKPAASKPATSKVQPASKARATAGARRASSA